MTFLGFSLYETEGIIQIKLTSIQPADSVPADGGLRAKSYFFNNDYIGMTLNFHPHFQDLSDTLKTIIGDNRQEYKFQACVEGIYNEFSMETRCCELPKDRILALALLDFINTFTKFTKDDFTYLTNYDYFAVDHKRLEDNFVVDKETGQTRLPSPLHDYFHGQFTNKRDVFQAILKAILTFRNTADYQETMSIVTMLLRNPADELGEPLSKTLCLLGFIKQLIQNDRQIELARIIPILNEITKGDLMAIGEGAMIRGRDFMESDARLFTEQATFFLRGDGKIGLFGISNNPIYQVRYAPGRMQERFFEHDMRELAAILRLDYDPESDFQKKIIFTDESSTRLKHMGLHLNLNYVKQLLFQKNRLRFFMSEIADLAQPCLPPELRKHIAEQIDKAELVQTIAGADLPADFVEHGAPAIERPSVSI
ncbi:MULTISPECIES: hypothetical protein [unclassified Legionella]|uniref:hypothetical protein n=1 Tax=unclassified Legionella TaxID=2622702 RepID=UPI003AF4CEFD